MSRKSSIAAFAGLVLMVALSSCTSSPGAGPAITASSSKTAASDSPSVASAVSRSTATSRVPVPTARATTPASIGRPASRTGSTSGPTARTASTTTPISPAGSAGGGDAGEIGSAATLSMPSMVGKPVTDLRAAIGNYPVVYRNRAGAVITAALSGTDVICAQQPHAGADLLGPAATLTVAPAGARC